MLDLNEPGILIKDTLLKTFLKHKCKFLAKDKRKIGFPGTQPKTFTKETFDKNKKYVVAEKTDGVRYLLLITQNDILNTKQYGHTFLVTRSFDFYGVPRMNDIWEYDIERLLLLNNTLMDGELVIDNDKEIVFYLFDVLCLGNTFFGYSNFYERISMCKYFVNYVNSIDVYNEDDVDIVFKVKNVLDATVENIKDIWSKRGLLPHGNDGLIFTERDTKYWNGSSSSVLKWKPLIDATVDFEISADNMYLIARIMGTPFIYDYYNDGLGSTPVMEAKLNTIKDKWEYVRDRPDKVMANDLNTIYNVVDSIDNSINIEELAKMFS